MTFDELFSLVIFFTREKTVTDGKECMLSYSEKRKRKRKRERERERERDGEGGVEVGKKERKRQGKWFLCMNRGNSFSDTL